MFILFLVLKKFIIKLFIDIVNVIKNLEIIFGFICGKIIFLRVYIGVVFKFIVVFFILLGNCFIFGKIESIMYGK